MKQLNLTPSQVLKQYDIFGRKVANTLVTEMREKFAALEIEGVPTWKILCDEVAGIDPETEEKIEQDKLWIAQACAEILCENAKGNKSMDGNKWGDRINFLNKPEEYLSLFNLLELQNKWMNGRNLRALGLRGLESAITKKYGKWSDFLQFMGIDTESRKKKIANCKSPDDFLIFFLESDIPPNDWVNEFKKESLASMRGSILYDPRFDSWEEFKKFMGVESRTIKTRVADCKSKKDFYELFDSFNIPEDKYLNGSWIQKNISSGLLMAISKDPRFNSWNAFKNYMGVYEESWPKKVAKCTERSEFLNFFKELTIPEGQWISSEWLQQNGFKPLYFAIYKDDRFGSWEAFLNFMGYKSPEKWRNRIDSCTTAKDYHEMFKGLKIPREIWINSFKLKNAKFSGLCKVIREKFGSWGAFLEFMDTELINVDEEFETISNFSLEEAISLLGHDPYKLKLYLERAHPELSDEEVDRIITRSFKGLIMGTTETKEQEYLKYPAELADITIEEVPHTTEEPKVTITGTAPQGTHICLAGCWNRRVRITDGTFSVVVPLKQGEENEVRLMAVDPQNNVRSLQEFLFIDQQSEVEDDTIILIMLLNGLSEKLLSDIRKNPGRYEYFKRCAEQLLIKKFSRSFEEGEEYIEGLIAESTSPTIRRVLRGVLAEFKRVHKMKLPNVQEGSLLFFQKYGAVEIRKRREEGRPGVILANDPGLGKTRTIEAAVSDCEAGIFCPNAVVSTWEEEAAEVLVDPDMLVMRDIPHKVRKEMLRTREEIRYVTNTQFLQNTKDTERFELLSSSSMVVVHDEAHSRANEHTEQSKGARMLDHQFQINVTATPARNPQAVRKMLKTLYPEDRRFGSERAFKAAFPADNPQALKTLNLLLQRDMIRFRKSDVMEVVDPNVSLMQQKHKLPAKEFVKPETMGQFTMSEKQAEAIYHMFLDWHDWTERYDKYLPDDDIAELDRLRTAGALTKRHALRQTINNPRYLGLRSKDNKATETQRIVEHCLSRGRKVVIFCAYNAQAAKYAEMFKEHNPALYTGISSNEGDKKDADGNAIRFKKEQGIGGSKRGWVFNAEGYPIEDKDGDTMSTLDYERLTFQNAADREINIVTYRAGAVGTTFTAGKAMIFDDLPADVIEAIQSEDRIQRIDPDRLTHATVEYYTLMSRYPKTFLERMKKRWIVRDTEEQRWREFKSKKAADNYASSVDLKAETVYDVFFEQGTYDEVHYENLGTQRKMFHLINDGIADETILEEGQIAFSGFENGNGSGE